MTTQTDNHLSVSTPLANKKILLGISGGIAAYKCAELVRRLSERGAQVRVVMTASAKEFITPLTMQAVSGHPVADSLLDPAAEASMGHIELAKWADLILIAPATANILAKLRLGMGDDLLTTLILATDAPVAIAPAMNQQMWANVATQENIEVLNGRGFMQWGPDAGVQACGDVGLGRMLEPMALVAHCESFFTSADNKKDNNKPWQGLKVTITAGPTREALDPVRYLTNQSSGKMGYALADAAKALGAEVTLISGPVTLLPAKGVHCIKVESAQQMYDASMSEAPKSDIFIACAAVADYRPEQVQTQKIKKTLDADTLTLTMVKNPDIVASVAKLIENRPFTVGFAAETQEVEQYAQDKLARKNLDMICANDVSNQGIGFNSERNQLNLYWKNGHISLPEASKIELAYAMLEQVLYRYKESNNRQS